MRIKHSFFGGVDFHFGDCIDCAAHTLVFYTENKVEDTASAKPKLIDKNGPRCVACIWKVLRNFKWKRRTIEDSPLYVAPPKLITADSRLVDPQGRPLVVGIDWGKAPPRALLREVNKGLARA